MSLTVLEWNFPTDPVVLGIFNKLNQVVHRTNFLGWIKALVGQKGNENANMLAKRANEDDQYYATAYVPFQETFWITFLEGA